MPVDASDVVHAVALATATLRQADPDGWESKAGSLEWTCWETLEHLADDLFSYATRFGLAHPPTETPLPFRRTADRPSGPSGVIFGDRAAGPEGLLVVVGSCGGLLASVVHTADPATLGYHVFVASDPEGFAAMGIVETLVHTHDLAEGLGLSWSPPRELCAKVLDRLFPHVEPSEDAWETLLWATGRASLPGRPHQTGWRWYGTPGDGPQR